MVMLYVLLAISIVALVLVGAVRIMRTEGSRFDLERRAQRGEREALHALEREERLGDLRTLKQLLSAFLLITTTLLSVAAYGWLLGIVIALMVALLYGALAQRTFVQKIVQARYEKYEPMLLRWIEKVPYVFSLLCSVTVDQVRDPDIVSPEQLLNLVEKSRGVLTREQKLLFQHGLTFGDVQVSAIMTPRSMIDSIPVSELLGPLVLNDLHKTGHSRFPVINGDLDHVVGVLHTHDLLVLDAGKHSATVKEVMEARVLYVHQDQTLDHVLSAFLKSHHHLFIVVNEYRETVGLLSLEDVMEALLGRKIIDEFDVHDDLRMVAARNPRSNNQAVKHTDV